MTDKTLTNGLESDRYLKARQLVYDFETRLISMLETTGREMLREAGYQTDVSFHDKALGPGFTTTLATIRTEAPIRHDDAADSTTKLNVGVEWVTPDTIDDTSAGTDAYSYVQYKIQHGSQTVYDTVRDATVRDDEWPDIRFYADQWYSSQKHAPGIVAIPLTEPEALENHLTTLTNHFAHVYAPAYKESL
ncbi:hypothetical protein [Haloprofundus halophilus]|uniref:hypothetical protein n=1 Tax=Haloprofundus halophilus TaxID=2283527 RepID=UPI000E442532|nr:hypothetical protein [Haloprofundus halophilus]